MHIPQKRKPRISYLFLITCIMTFNSTTIFASAMPSTCPAPKHPGHSQKRIQRSTLNWALLSAAPSKSAQTKSNDEIKAMNYWQTATAAAPAHATTAFAPQQTGGPAIKEEAFYKEKAPSPLIIENNNKNITDDDSEQDISILTIKILTIKGEADAFASTLMDYFWNLKKSMDKAQKNREDIREIALLFRKAHQAYEQLHEIDKPRADRLWTHFNQYNGMLFTSIKDYFEHYTNLLHSQVYRLSFKTKDRMNEGINFTFNKPNPWPLFIQSLGKLKLLFSGQWQQYFAGPIWKAHSAQYAKSTACAQTYEKAQAVTAHMIILLNDLEKDIEQQGKHDCIASYISLSEQYDSIIDIEPQLSPYEKKRAEYRALLKKTSKETAAAK